MKKKLFWALGSLTMALVVVAASIGITIAALQAQVQSGFTISYTAKNVEAAVNGVWGDGSFIGGIGNAYPHQDGLGGGDCQNINDADFLIFDKQTSSGSFDPIPNIDFSFKNKEETPLCYKAGSVYFSYQMLNFNEYEIPVGLNFQKTNTDSSSDNLKIEYCAATYNELVSNLYASIESQEYEEFAAKYDAELNDPINTTPSAECIKEYYKIADQLVYKFDANSTTFPEDAAIPYFGESLEQFLAGEFPQQMEMLIVIIKISLIDETKNAKLSGSFNFTLG